MTSRAQPLRGQPAQRVRPQRRARAGAAAEFRAARCRAAPSSDAGARHL